MLDDASFPKTNNKHAINITSQIPDYPRGYTW